MSRDRCFFESASLILELSRFFLFSDSKWRGESSEKTHRVTQLINSLETIRIVFSATCCIQRDEILWRFCIAAVLIERPTEMAPSRKRNRDCRNRVLRRVFFLVVREFICANVRVRDSSSQKKKKKSGRDIRGFNNYSSYSNFLFPIANASWRRAFYRRAKIRMSWARILNASLNRRSIWYN